MGAFYPYNRGSLFTALIVLYALTAGISGYVACSYYRQMEGGSWVRNVLATSFVYCGPLFLVFCFNNTVAIGYRVRLPPVPSACWGGCWVDLSGHCSKWRMECKQQQQVLSSWTWTWSWTVACGPSRNPPAPKHSTAMSFSAVSSVRLVPCAHAPLLRQSHSAQNRGRAVSKQSWDRHHLVVTTTLWATAVSIMYMPHAWHGEVSKRHCLVTWWTDLTPRAHACSPRLRCHSAPS